MWHKNDVVAIVCDGAHKELVMVNMARRRAYSPRAQRQMAVSNMPTKGIKCGYAFVGGKLCMQVIDPGELKEFPVMAIDRDKFEKEYL